MEREQNAEGGSSLGFRGLHAAAQPNRRRGLGWGSDLRTGPGLDLANGSERPGCQHRGGLQATPPQGGDPEQVSPPPPNHYALVRQAQEATSLLEAGERHPGCPGSPPTHRLPVSLPPCL